MAEIGAAIVGLSDNNVFPRGVSTKSSLTLALNAIQGAAQDAGLAVEDIDGFCSFGLHAILAGALVDCLGTREFRYGGSPLNFGGSGMVGSLQSAVGAIQSRQANYVVMFKSLHSNETRVSAAGGYLPVGDYVSYQPGYESSHFAGSFTAPYGLYIPYEAFALHAQRYLYDTGATPEDLAQVALTFRKHAQANPNGRFHGRPLTLEAYLDSPMIADPLRKFDLCLENDFGVAIIVTSMERARDLQNIPVRIGALSFAVGYLGNRGIYGDRRYHNSFLGITADRLWKESDYQLSDISNAQLYDMTTAAVLVQLEDIGFCGRGQAAAYVKSGGIAIGSSGIPVNTAGGQLSNSYALGMTLLAEAIRQVRGDSYNQLGYPSLVSNAPYTVPSGLVVLDR